MSGPHLGAWTGRSTRRDRRPAPTRRPHPGHPHPPHRRRADQAPPDERSSVRRLWTEDPYLGIMGLGEPVMQPAEWSSQCHVPRIPLVTAHPRRW